MSDYLIKNLPSSAELIKADTSSFNGALAGLSTAQEIFDYIDDNTSSTANKNATLGLYDAAWTYSSGAFCFYNNKIYYSLVNSNLNNQPDTSSTQWRSYLEVEFVASLPATGVSSRIYIRTSDWSMSAWNGTSYETLSAGSGSVWGSITGTLSDQTDLQIVLNGKSDTGHTHSGYSLTTHTHDDRYYTETETNTLLSGKSDTNHTHSDLHSHANKTLLDSYNQSNANISTAVTNSHTHSNKATLDNITNAGDGNSFLANDGTYKAVSGSGAVDSVNGATGTVVLDSDDISEGTTNLYMTTTQETNFSTAYTHSQITSGNPHNIDKSDVGLGNVDNTSDTNKPISSATQTALNGKADASHNHDLLYAEIAYEEKVDNILMASEPTGFLNATDSTISFTNATRTFTIQPAVTSYVILQVGVKYTISTTKTIVISNTEGLHYIYFDNGILYETLTLDINVVKTKVLVAIVYWDATNSIHLTIADERHGCVMDSETHWYLHQTVGSAYVSGGSLGNFSTEGTGNSATDAQFSISTGSFKDEDILFNLQSVASTVGNDIYYRSGTTAWRKSTNTGFNLLTTGTGRLAYNLNTTGTWSLAEVTSNQFALYHIFMSNDINRKYIAIVGQAAYTSVATARTGAATEMLNLVTDGLPFKEFVAIGTVILETRNSYTNAVKSRIRLTDTGGSYIDWRLQKITPLAGSTASHSLLSNRSDANSHPATAISYDGATSGLSATTTQQAFDELASEKVDKTTTINGLDLSANRTLTQDNISNGSTYVRTTNDYTTTEKNKLSGIEAGSQVNTVTSVAGRTGGVVLTKSDVELGNVDNTSDINKPISTATQTALNGKSDTTHNHDATYAQLSHTHTDLHTHTNKSTLDNITASGNGNSFLANDGTYKTVSSGSASWGGITGTLSSQTDLQTALNNKSDTTHTHNFIDLNTEPMKKTLLYYGYPTSINEVWSVEGAVAVYVNYDVIIFGDGYQDSGHEENQNMIDVITELKVLKPNIQIFGYIPIGMGVSGANLTMTVLKARADEWLACGATGLFLDEFGYDYEVTRDRQNEIVVYAHGLGLNVIANSWTLDHVFSKQNIIIDWLSNFNGNPNLLESELAENDYYLFEHLFWRLEDITGNQLNGGDNWKIYEAVRYNQDIDQGGYTSGETYRQIFGTQLMVLDGIGDARTDKESLFLQSYIGSKIINIDAYCASVSNWGADNTNYIHYKYDFSDLQEKTQHTTVMGNYNGTYKKFSATINGTLFSLYWDRAADVAITTGSSRIEEDGVVRTHLYISVDELYSTILTNETITQYLVATGKSVTAQNVVTMLNSGVANAETLFGDVSNTVAYNTYGTTTCPSLCSVAMSSTKVMVAYANNANGGYGTARILTINPDDSITAGTDVSFKSYSCNPIAIAGLTSTKAIVCYKNGFNNTATAQILNFDNGSAVTSGTSFEFDSTCSHINVIALSPVKALCVFKDEGNTNYGTAVILHISGSTITKGTAVVFESATTEFPTSSLTALNSNKIIVCYRDVGNSNYGTLVPITITGFDTLTVGTPAVFESSNVDNTVVTRITDSKLIVTYRDITDSNKGKARIINIADNGDITVGSSYIFTNDTIYDCVNATYVTQNKIFISWNTSDTGKSTLLSVDSTDSMSIGNVYTYRNGVPARYITISLLTATSSIIKVLVSFSDTSSRPTAIILNIPVTTPSNIIGITKTTGNAGSSVNISYGTEIDGFTGLTVGSLYYLQENGSIGLTQYNGYAPLGVAISTTELKWFGGGEL
jgi:hypothetical protein